jgi:hypothetical protein
MLRKGRQRQGEKNPRARLNAEQVRMIRGWLASGETPASIAARVGVTKEAISSIKAGRNWRHVLPGDSRDEPVLPTPLEPESGQVNQRDFSC